MIETIRLLTKQKNIRVASEGRPKPVTTTRMFSKVFGSRRMSSYFINWSCSDWRYFLDCKDSDFFADTEYCSVRKIRCSFHCVRNLSFIGNPTDEELHPTEAS